MLLDNNTEKVIDLLNMYDDLNNIDKIRLAIHLLMILITLLNF